MANDDSPPPDITIVRPLTAEQLVRKAAEEAAARAKELNAATREVELRAADLELCRAAVLAATDAYNKAAERANAAGGAVPAQVRPLTAVEQLNARQHRGF